MNSYAGAGGHVRAIIDEYACFGAACQFGCDDLYERGFVTVESDGSVALAGSLQSPTERDYALQFLADKTCSAWSADSAPYFVWHRANRGR